MRVAFRCKTEQRRPTPQITRMTITLKFFNFQVELQRQKKNYIVCSAANVKCKNFVFLVIFVLLRRVRL